MIIVDVYVPVYEKTYDMEIDEGLGIASGARGVFRHSGTPEGWELPVF